MAFTEPKMLYTEQQVVRAAEIIDKYTTEFMDEEYRTVLKDMTHEQMQANKHCDFIEDTLRDYIKNDMCVKEYKMGGCPNTIPNAVLDLLCDALHNELHTGTPICVYNR